MKKQKVHSKFDKLVETLIPQFLKIPNFDLLSKDEVANKAFSIIVFRISDIRSYKELICQHFIPATNKAIFDSQKDFNNSKYKFLLKPHEVDFKETLYDTVRLAYVGLFHKLENYINDVIKIPELIFGDLYETHDIVAKWAKDKFNFDIKNWQQFSITREINWICNCVKHKDGFPVKEPKPERFRYIDSKQRIRITPEEFKTDCEKLIQFYPIYLQVMLLFAQHKLVNEKPIKKEEYESSPQFYDAYTEKLGKLETSLHNLMTMLKSLD